MIDIISSVILQSIKDTRDWTNLPIFCSQIALTTFFYLDVFSPSQSPIQSSGSEVLISQSKSQNLTDILQLVEFCYEFRVCLRFFFFNLIASADSEISIHHICHELSNLTLSFYDSYENDQAFKWSLKLCLFLLAFHHRTQKLRSAEPTCFINNRTVS